jgi:hypothetical protein
VPPGAAQLANAKDAARTFPPALNEVFIEHFPTGFQARIIDESRPFFNR